jgi:hypothetical protein
VAGRWYFLLLVGDDRRGGGMALSFHRTHIRSEIPLLVSLLSIVGPELKGGNERCEGCSNIWDLKVGGGEGTLAWE